MLLNSVLGVEAGVYRYKAILFLRYYILPLKAIRCTSSRRLKPTPPVPIAALSVASVSQRLHGFRQSPLAMPSTHPI